MDDLDRKILSLLAKNARMPVKEIAEQVALTSPAVSSRIHRLEQEGIIGGYTVVLRHLELRSALMPSWSWSNSTGGENGPTDMSRRLANIREALAALL